MVKTDFFLFCFNRRVVILVADKLKRQWVRGGYFGNSLRQLERKLAQIILEGCNRNH